MTWPSIFSLLTGICNILLALYINAKAAATERTKLAYSRGDIVFKRQLESLDAIAIVLAEPMNVYATTMWIDGRGTILLRPTDIGAVTEKYLHVAAAHFYTLGPEFVLAIDNLFARGWEIVRQLLLSKSRVEFETAQASMNDHRSRCLEAAEAFLSNRSTEALHNQMKDPHARIGQILTDISSALPEIEARSAPARLGRLRQR